MRFTQDSASSINVIRSYGGGELRVNDSVYTGTVIISPSTVIGEPGIKNLLDLERLDLAALLALEPELVLLGTGSRQSFPSPGFGAKFLRGGIGFEVMDTGAACRTYNVLVMEHRQVAAILLPL